MASSTAAKCIYFQFNFTKCYIIVRILMLATPNSRGVSTPKFLGLQRIARWTGVAKYFQIACWVLLSFAAAVALGEDGTTEFARKAEAAYNMAKAALDAHPDQPEAMWQFGRAAFDLAEFAGSDNRRAELAQQGIDSCRKLVSKKPDSAFGHYYLAMNLGQLARTKFLGALKLVGEMESEFKAALKLDPAIDSAGPDRNLGLLYFQAPGWPTSVGSKPKARQHFQAALKLAPDDPENHLNLIEAELKWNERSSAAQEFKAIEELWPEARKKLTGDAWAPSWVDWEKRKAALAEKLAETSKATESPRNK